MHNLSDSSAPDTKIAAGPRNLLLAARSAKEYDQVRPHLEVNLKPLAVLIEMGKPVDYVWFPENAVISVVCGGLATDGGISWG